MTTLGHNIFLLFISHCVTEVAAIKIYSIYTPVILLQYTCGLYEENAYSFKHKHNIVIDTVDTRINSYVIQGRMIYQISKLVTIIHNLVLKMHPFCLEHKVAKKKITFVEIRVGIE